MTQTAQPHLELPLRETQQKDRRSFVIAAAFFAALSILSACLSPGFLEADAISHYLAARFSLEQPYRFVSVWDRPLFVLLYSLPARLGGMIGARLMSLAIALACAAITWAIAGRLGIKRPAVAAACLLVQPLFFLHSFAEMTELIFACCLGLAFLGYLGERWWLLALATAVMPLGRPEGFGFLAIAAIALLAHRRWWYLPILPAGLLAWSLAGWTLFGCPDYGWGSLSFLRWLPEYWPYSGKSVYQSGPLLFWRTGEDGTPLASFLLRLPVIVSPILLPFVIWGVVRCVAPWRSFFRDALRRNLILAAGIPLGILAGHSFLWWRGLMASSGELRYLLIASPFWAILAAQGLIWATARRRRITWGILMLAGATPILWNFCYMVVPLGLYEDDLLARDVIQWYRSQPALSQRYPRLCAASVNLYKELDSPPGDGAHSVRWGRETVESRAGDVLIIWDVANATHNADDRMIVSREQLEQAGWRLLRTFERSGRTWEAFAQ